ncbi:MAG: protein kinase, partial [Pseudomonadota bacterium]
MGAAREDLLISQGSMVDHYQILQLLGCGGMGEVYLARDVKLGRRVALKMIHQDRLPSDRDTVERFLEEARITASFNHPHIVTVYGVGEYQGSPYLALEYVDGQTLRQRMNEERLAAKEVMRIGLAIAQALAEAHRNRVLHRDLKPENVMMGRDGRLRVLDLGLAKLLPAENQAIDPAVAAQLVAYCGEDSAFGEATIVEMVRADSFSEDSRASRRGVLAGTPAYVAPEGWKGEQIAEAADIWALGMVLYELLVGRRPYQDMPLHVFPFVVASSLVVSPAKGPGIPEELSDLIAQCLSKEPGGRPTAEHVAARLGILLGRRFLEGATSPFRGLSAFSERHTDLFFGRDAEVAAFVEQLREQPVLSVVGPSGAGKSSFVQAGVIPRLREQGSWLVLRLRPGSDPFGALASCLSKDTARVTGGADPSAKPLDLQIVADDQARLAATERNSAEARLSASLRERPLLLNVILHELEEKEGKKVLLFVDQFEEVFTLVGEEETRQRFVESVCRAEEYAKGPVRVVVTIRDDFLGHVADGVEKGAAFERIVVLRRPNSSMLEQMLCLPLQNMGYRFDDPTLVGEMIASVQGEPACLPLLQFAGQMLWERCDQGRRLILRSAYESIGGVAGALAEHADGVLAGMSSSRVRVAHELLLGLVTPEGTRRIVPVGDVLKNLGAEGQAVLGTLSQARLVTLRKGGDEAKTGTVVELTHESLIRSWRRLARWIEESREERVFLVEVEQAARLWETRGGRDEEVWQGDALADARRKLVRFVETVPEQVARFVHAGVRKEKRRRLRKRLLAAGTMAFLAVVAVVSFWQRELAESREVEAQTQRARAEQREAEVQSVGARAAYVRGDLLAARAMLRSSLETRDSALGRTLMWQLDDQALVWRRMVGGHVNAVDFSSDGSIVAAASADRSIYLFDVDTASVRVLRGHRDHLASVVFSPDGRYLAAGSWAGPIYLWDLSADEDNQRVFEGHTGQSNVLAFSPDGRRLASGSFDSTVRLWEVASGSQVAVLTGHASTVRCLGFSSDGRLLASGGLDRIVRLWDVAGGVSTGVLAGHSAGVAATAFSRDGRSLASLGDDRMLRLWDVDRRLQVQAMEVPATPQSGTLSYRSAVVELVFVGKTPSSLEVWTVDVQHGSSSRKTTVQLGSALADVRCVAMRYDQRLLAVGSEDKTASLWRIGESREERRDSGHQGGVRATAFSPNGAVLASAGDDASIRLWDVASGEERRVLVGHGAAVNWVAFSPDGRLLASTSNDKTVRLWESSTGQQIMVLAGHEHRINTVTFSADGRKLASASYDRTARIWDAATGSVLQVLRGHGHIVWAAAFSPAGDMVATASVDKTVRIWDTASGNELRRLEGHAGFVRAVIFGKDSNQVISGGLDQTVRVWDWRTKTSRTFVQQSR